MKTHKTHRLATAVSAVLGAAGGTACAQTYSVTDLGTLGGPVAAGFGVNNAGHAVGASTLATADYHGLVWSGSGPGAIQPLSGDTQCWAFGIDGTDTVVAMSYSFAGAGTRGLAWRNGAATPLGDFAPRAISNTGLIAGFVSINDPDLGQLDHAALWDAGAVTDLGTLGGSSSYAAGVNGFSQVVGWSWTAADEGTRATLWQGGTVRDLGTLGGATSQAYAISDNRGVVGVADTAGGQPHGFFVSLDSAGNVTSRLDLGALAAGWSYALGLNNSADIVGTSGSRAFLWHAGTMTDLNSTIPAASGWVLERAWAISDAGQIVGTGLHGGFPRAFLLERACYANCDASTTAPVLNVNDFSCFLNRFAAGDPYANCDASTTAPVLNVLDFSCFLNRFATGCP